MYKTILVPLDGSPTSELALPMALSLARALAAQLVLTEVVHGSLGNGAVSHDSGIRAMDEAAAYLSAVATRLGDDGVDIQTTTPFGSAVAGILDAVELHQADMVVMTTHGRSGFSRLRHGSVAEAVLRHSPVPVLLVRAGEHITQPAFDQQPVTLLVPLDGSTFAEEALPPAIALAQALDATLTLVHVQEPPVVRDDDILANKAKPVETLDRHSADVETYVTQLSQQLRDMGVAVHAVVRSGEVVQALLEECWTVGASLIVMATHGRTGLPRAIYGSVALDILRHGTLPVLMVRPADFAQGRPQGVYAGEPLKAGGGLLSLLRR